MHVSALSGEYYILADFLRWLNVTLPHRCRSTGTDGRFGRAGFVFYSPGPARNDSAADGRWLRASATIKNVFRNRRLACLILGMWLGAAAIADVIVALNFSTVDRFLVAPGGNATATEINRAGHNSVRYILRRNAAEENATIFESWEWTQIIVGIAFFLLILFGDRKSEAALIMEAGMVIIVLVQRFVLTPQVISLGREAAETSQVVLDNPVSTQFGVYHGIYAVSEILKLVIGVSLAIRLMLTRRDHDRFAKDYDAAMGPGKTGAEGRGLPWRGIGNG